MAAPKILIVDDERDSTFALEKTLSLKGYRVITAERGQNAIVLAQSELPDLILLDVMLPDIHGGDVAKVLQKDHATKNIPIIFLSCLFTKEEENRIEHKAGQFMMFAKPYNLGELLLAIEKMLPSATPEQQGPPTTRSFKILIIDNDRNFVSSLIAHLRKNQLEAVAGFEASSAVHQALESNPNLIILNTKLPGGDGFELLHRFSNNTKLAHIPVIMMSNVAEPGAKEKASNRGAVAFFEKPAGFDKLQNVIWDVLTKGQVTITGENSNENRRR